MEKANTPAVKRSQIYIGKILNPKSELSPHEGSITTGYDLSHLTQILMEQLEKKGLKPSMIPGFIRDLANTILVNPQMSLLEVNKRLDILGWDSFELDYHILQLAIACFEAEGLKYFESKPSYWFETNFRSHNCGING